MLIRYTITSLTNDNTLLNNTSNDDDALHSNIPN